MSGGALHITLVVAAARNGVIGRDGSMPWRMSSSLRRFRQLTMGRPMIMGRKTYAPIGRALDGRDSIVITRQAAFQPSGVHVAASLGEAFAIARRLAAERGVDEIVIAGGGEVYRAAMPYATRVELDLIEAEPTGDTVFAPLDPETWTEVARAPVPRLAGDDWAMKAVRYERRGAAAGLGEP